MDSYLDISVRPDPEFAAAQLMSVLFSKMHKAMVQMNNIRIGVSFPNHTPKSLGDKLRLHGSASALSQLMSQGWLIGMCDYVLVSEVATAPAHAKYRSVHRVQAKSNPERLRRRAMRRHNWDNATAMERIPDSAAESLSLPYVRIVSSSTKHHFPLFIRHGPVSDDKIEGSFNSYGLSARATIPWF